MSCTDTAALPQELLDLIAARPANIIGARHNRPSNNMTIEYRTDGGCWTKLSDAECSSDTVRSLLQKNRRIQLFFDMDYSSYYIEDSECDEDDSASSEGNADGLYKLFTWCSEDVPHFLDSCDDSVFDFFSYERVSIADGERPGDGRLQWRNLMAPLDGIP